jgi:hypothetical protein
VIITITEIGEAKHQSKGKSHWSEFEVKYTTDKGQDSKRTMRSFDNTWEASKAMEVGKSYDVSVKKNDKGYWEWVSIKETSAGGGSQSAARQGGGNASSGGYWDEKFLLDKERFEFDKVKQPLIIRQSCISSAVASLPPGSSVDEILARASAFEEYVNSEADLKPMDVE